MKKWIGLIIILALCLSICACAGADEEAALPELGEYALYAGFGRENITPLEPVPMGGYGVSEKRIHQNVLDDIYITAIALTDRQGETILLMNWDGVRAYTKTQEMVRLSISQKTGIALDHIFLGCTHSHSAPDMDSSMDSINRYVAYVIQQSTKCAQEALADRRPANMSAGTVEAEGLNFVRHYVTTQADGTDVYFGDSFGTSVYNDTTKHVSQADPTMFMLYFDMASGKDMALINWRAHPHFTGGLSKYDLSADWCGPFRDAFEYATGVDMLYFNGAAGNINEKSRMQEENRTTDYKTYGKLLSDYAVELMNNHLEPVAVDKIQTGQTMFEGKINHSMDHLYTTAREIQAVWIATANTTLVKEMGAPYGIRSPYHANAIANNYKKGETEVRELNAIMLGDSVSLVTAPNELFDINSQWLEANAPTKYTLTLGYTNGHYGYIPSASTWDYTSYETDITLFERGAAEQYQECFLDMLNRMYENR